MSDHLPPEEEPSEGGPEPEPGEKPEGEPERREGQVTEEE